MLNAIQPKRAKNLRNLHFLTGTILDIDDCPLALFSPAKKQNRSEGRFSAVAGSLRLHVPRRGCSERRLNPARHSNCWMDVMTLYRIPRRVVIGAAVAGAASLRGLGGVAAQTVHEARLANAADVARLPRFAIVRSLNN